MLYVVGTPIGNLDDISVRALKTLENVDIIACEDTRNTQKLLNYFQIKNKKLISFHEHNEEKISQKIIELIEENKNVALVSDAGMPCISDPGYILVNKCISKKIKVITIPGPNAALTALVSSGIESYTYTFYGFLPRKKKDLKVKLNEILLSKHTSIIYESPHRIINLIENICEISNHRIISVSRELTKFFEEVVTDTSEKILEKFKRGNLKVKGEFVVIISPNKEETHEEIDNFKLIEEVKKMVDNGSKSSTAIKIVADKYGINKREVYNLYHEEII
ncbi:MULTISPECIES: 16S rRNA (cytidine(1402)-2'-O)-methyltransferase [unclassified Gemella]|uniref:16S rRNA (cytidine(1402)-2'-O)-methyltransferase n=1 Tax=unclassified Gemella TaxID=2624949 RepID=UPI001073ADC9|nr:MULTISPECIES: 16S rRNA (cytidine(1402)-2'-O)-methyltransferase [unclassified Gemella]MBF0710068.1 16S rRNA (cytidine(1402)-2'-O)-methyltransferase [Gemella sp. GL1.1]MBF0746147.1 16S rRNA (cytidine(1402)-2'-O)-methyltransferase [Gemella sp. 19428wG2_WT2a]NYS27412.1 16S rRNA (cytidine(1402)-2'-O)-methyltransferase [Gemella sp. GL1]TFU60433.1 16S rRNA (cytidine(1402)-2'-O)-methyltransferase [Gemella sp. WT2a]